MRLGPALIVGWRDVRVAAWSVLLLATVRLLAGSSFGLSCPLLATTGVPCPFCGTSTAVSATLGLDLATAFAANPAGPFVVAMSAWVAVRRRRIDLRLPIVLLGVTVAAMWVFELRRFGWW